MKETEKIRNYLAYEFTDPIRDPVWNHIYLSTALKKVVATTAFQKLAGIKQLGPTYLVYPGATHNRLNHSLGVFAISRRVMSALISFDTAGDFTETGVRSFLCAALLHDLGHFPYAHSLKELPLKDHESLTALCVLEPGLSRVIAGEAHADPEMVARIVDVTMDDLGSREIIIYRRILSGVLDPDKLDYLSRDAYFCGVPYGVQDIDFIISKLRYHHAEGLVLNEQGLHAVENVLFSKYLMYRSVYWHKAVRIATAMIKKAMYLSISTELIKPDDLYGIDDNEFFSRYGDDQFRYRGLINRVAERRFYKSIWEAPFEPGCSLHERLRDLDSRAQLEGDIANELQVEETAVILDIPERISFEVDLHIMRDEELSTFTEAGAVFSKGVVDGFTRNLRKIRLLVRPDLAAIISSEAITRWMK